PVGFAYTTPQSRHWTLSSTVNLGVGPESGFTWKKNPLFAETCVSLVAKNCRPRLRLLSSGFSEPVFRSGWALHGTRLLDVARDLSHQLGLVRERSFIPEPPPELDDKSSPV